MGNISFGELVVFAILFLVIAFSIIRFVKFIVKRVVYFFAARVAEKMKQQS